MAGKSSILFDVIGNVICFKSQQMYQKHVNDTELFKTFSKYMLLRYLTMSYSSAVRSLIVDNYLTLERMPEKALYRWLLMNVPKQNSSFIRYIK